MITLLTLLFIVYIITITKLVKTCNEQKKTFNIFVNGVWQYIIFCFGTIVFGGFFIYFCVTYLP